MAHKEVTCLLSVTRAESLFGIYSGIAPWLGIIGLVPLMKCLQINFLYIYIFFYCSKDDISLPPILQIEAISQPIFSNQHFLQRFVFKISHT